ncbi:molybdenum cofactor guanylyltransferase [Halorubrum sp. SY-15]|uniref:molybdenum cofactor guanylyltransferase n=1 Tax=Halorubrum sp. SY-15 TaxID=3402277 RepID=UPI003EB9E178
MTTSEAGSTGDDLRGVVLAGGRSRRFGDRDKALATLDGRTLVSRAVDAVASLAARPPLVAVGTASRRALLGSGIGRPVEYVFDPPGTGGPVGGILAAARATEAERIAVVGCDMPLVTTEAIRWLAGQSADADAIVPVDEGGQLQPVFAVYRTTALTAVESRLTSAALFGLLDELDVHRVPVASAPTEGGVDRALTNVNTPADLERLRDGTDSRG